MKTMNRKAILFLMLLILCALLSGCYKEVDPWPSSAPLSTQLTPTEAPTPEVTAMPTATPQPAEEILPEEEDFWPDEQPTRVPGGEAAPGFNG